MAMSISQLLVVAAISGAALFGLQNTSMEQVAEGRARMPTTPYKFDKRLGISAHRAVDLDSSTVTAKSVGDEKIVGGVIRIILFNGVQESSGKVSTTIINTVLANCERNSVIVIGSARFAPSGELNAKAQGSVLSVHEANGRDETPSNLAYAALCGAKVPEVDKGNEPDQRYKDFWAQPAP